MPIYEYECTSCGHQFDELQKLSDKPLKVCPKCHQRSLTKLVSAPSFRLKGSGWYETDFKKDKRKNLADDGNADKPKNDKSEKKDSKSDSSSKPEKPKETKKKSSKKKDD